MMDTVTSEYCGLPVIHSNWNRHHQGALGMTQALVHIRVEPKAFGRVVELGQSCP